MAEAEQKQHLALKLIAGLREKLHRKNDNEQEENKTTRGSFPSPRDVAAIFKNLQDKWENEEAEKAVLYQFIDEWIVAHTKKD